MTDKALMRTLTKHMPAFISEMFELFGESVDFEAAGPVVPILNFNETANKLATIKGLANEDFRRFFLEATRFMVLELHVLAITRKQHCRSIALGVCKNGYLASLVYDKLAKSQVPRISKKNPFISE
jgi:hypothetical protein